jgi:proline dehydrogenase
MSGAVISTMHGAVSLALAGCLDPRLGTLQRIGARAPAQKPAQKLDPLPHAALLARIRRPRRTEASEMSALNNLVLATLPYIPRPLMRRLASRYIAGETLEEALAKLVELARRGHPGILDILGEGITSESQAREVMLAYKSAATHLAEQKLDAYVSVKPTHLALTLSEPVCLALYVELARHCRERALFMRVEMEDHPTTDATLRVFEALRAEFDNVGIVLQSRLFRTPRDIDALKPGPLDVRMVKGIYLEPPVIAHTEPEPIRDAYVECTRKLLERGARVALATHDGGLADRCFALMNKLDVKREGCELEVLLGVREDLWSAWKQDGRSVRVYVPFGPEWRAYSQRRLRKNPQILRHVMRDALSPRHRRS